MLKPSNNFAMKGISFTFFFSKFLKLHRGESKLLAYMCASVCIWLNETNILVQNIQRAYAQHTRWLSLPFTTQEKYLQKTQLPLF